MGHRRSNIPANVEPGSCSKPAPASWPDPGRPRPAGGHVTARDLGVRARPARSDLRHARTVVEAAGERLRIDAQAGVGGAAGRDPVKHAAPPRRRAAPRRRDPGRPAGVRRGRHGSSRRDEADAPVRIVALEGALLRTRTPSAVRWPGLLRRTAGNHRHRPYVFVPADRYADVARRCPRWASTPTRLRRSRRRSATADADMWDETPIDLFFAYDAFHDAAAVATRVVPFADTTISILNPSISWSARQRQPSQGLGRHRRDGGARRHARRRRGPPVGRADCGYMDPRDERIAWASCAGDDGWSRGARGPAAPTAPSSGLRPRAMDQDYRRGRGGRFHGWFLSGGFRLHGRGRRAGAGGLARGHGCLLECAGGCGGVGGQGPASGSRGSAPLKRTLLVRTPREVSGARL